MANPLRAWLDDRSGVPTLVRAALDEPVRGGPRLRYVFGSALAGAFLIQLVTGLLLMTSYVPSSSQAWGSVWYIQTQMDAGWFIRGLHHWGSSAVVVLLVLHLLQGVVTAAFRAPRELNWWLGLALMALMLGMALTGYLLPWDQKGYWATRVATNIAGSTPVLGPAIQTVLVGGTEYGNQTLTRLYTLHVGLLPWGIGLLLIGHYLLARRHGLTGVDRPDRTESYFPAQSFLNLAAVFVTLIILVWIVDANHGAQLDAPADPSSTDYPARPEWYFLFLYQLLNEFESPYEIIGTMVIPGAIATILVALPLLDRLLPRRLVHFGACALVFGLVGGAAFLTIKALSIDARDDAFVEARFRADSLRRRALQLAKAEGVPGDGAVYLLRRDPLVHGKNVTVEKCLSCHYYSGQGASIPDASGKLVAAPQTAADLQAFGTRGWLRSLLDNPSLDRHFGKVPQCGGMKEWKAGSKLTPGQLDEVADFFERFVILADPLVPPLVWEARDDVQTHPGYRHWTNECANCHAWGEGGGSSTGLDAPNLYGWGSPAWIERMILDPGAPDLYGYLEAHEQMPSFRGQLSENDLDTVIRFIKGEYLPGLSENDEP